MVVEGTPYVFAGELVVDAPTELVSGCTRRRVLIRNDGADVTCASTAVRLHDGRVVLVLPRLVGGVEGRPIKVEIALTEDTRSVGPPQDLVQALQAHGLSLDGLAKHELRHLVSLVREARDPTVRAQRIAAVMERLEALAS